jgi:hypothetical protein
MRSLGRHGHRWDSNTKMNLQEITLEDMECIDLAQDRDKWWPLENVFMNFQVQ